jgi:hypothetical protein
VTVPKAEVRKLIAWTVLLWAGMMLSCQSKQQEPRSELQPQPTAVEESWTDRAAKISQEELDQLAEHVTRRRQLQAQLRQQCPSQEDSVACQQVLEEAASQLERSRAKAIRAVADPRSRLRLTELQIRKDLSQAEDTARRHLETVVLALFELSKKQREEGSNP